MTNQQSSRGLNLVACKTSFNIRVITRTRNNSRYALLLIRTTNRVTTTVTRLWRTKILSLQLICTRHPHCLQSLALQHLRTKMILSTFLTRWWSQIYQTTHHITFNNRTSSIHNNTGQCLYWYLQIKQSNSIRNSLISSQFSFLLNHLSHCLLHDRVINQLQTSLTWFQTRIRMVELAMV